MESFDYLVALFSIVIGLGLAEVAVSLNRLLRSAGLKHDPLIFGPPILVMLMLVSIWFDTWAIKGVPNLFTFPFSSRFLGSSCCSICSPPSAFQKPLLRASP